MKLSRHNFQVGAQLGSEGPWGLRNFPLGPEHPVPSPWLRGEAGGARGACRRRPPPPPPLLGSHLISMFIPYALRWE